MKDFSILPYIVISAYYRLSLIYDDTLTLLFLRTNVFSLKRILSALISVPLRHLFGVDRVSCMFPIVVPFSLCFFRRKVEQEFEIHKLQHVT